MFFVNFVVKNEGIYHEGREEHEGILDNTQIDS